MNTGERLKLIKEKQNEERVRKLESIKQQANASQFVRQKTDEERRLLIEQHKIKEFQRRQQVDERKKEMAEIDKNRKEAILRKSQERDARIENRRKMERSSIVFAFGSSTPRMLDPSESAKAYWTNHRASSTMDVMSVSMTAAIPDRSGDKFSHFVQLNDSKRRSTCADDDGKGRERTHYITPYLCSQQVARKKTDLMPVVRSLRGSLCPSSPVKGSKTPNRALSMSRLDALAQPRIRHAEKTPENHYFLKSNVDITKSMTHLVSGRKPVRYSAAFELQLSPTQVINDKEQHKTLARNKCNNNSVSQLTQNNLSPEEKLSASNKNLPSRSHRSVQNNAKDHVIPVVGTTNKSDVNKKPSFSNNVDKSSANDSAVPDVKKSPQVEADAPDDANAHKTTSDDSVESYDDNSCSIPTSDTLNDLAECDMTGSITTAVKYISSEEEAKLALAAKRKAVKEQIEKELEEQRKREEMEKIMQENYIKNEEKEQLELLEMAKKAEEERLNAAILEMKKREEEDNQKQEILLKQKLEKADTERKAKEDIERLRQETELKLQKEEEERQARRKRVEAIMSRTRTNRLSTNIVASTEINS